MRNIKIGEGQCLADVAMQYCGDAEVMFEISALNGVGITEGLVPGTALFVPDYAIDKTNIFAAFRDNGLVPASIEFDTDGLLDGIDYWIIEEDFIIR